MARNSASTVVTAPPVCPHGALTLNTMPLTECPGIQHNLLPKAAQIRQLLMARRSIRFYKERVVAHDLLEDLDRYDAVCSDRE